MVNGQGPYDFILDTGATLTLAFENLAAEQEFTPSELPPRRILGLLGAEQVPVTDIGDISVGGLLLEDHTGVVLSDWAPPRRTPKGVLGLDFLTRYFVLIDSNAKRIEFYDREAPPPPQVKKWAATNLKQETFEQDSGALYVIKPKLNNRAIPFILDLGASGTIINYPALRSLFSGIRFNQPRTAGGATSSRLNDIHDGSNRARLVRIQRIKIGNQSWRKPELIAYNAEIFRELNVADEPYGLFGSDLLAGRSFALDFNRGRFYVERGRR